MPKVSEERLSRRREQILAGARQCFARYGFEAATVRRLEAATGLSRGAIFHHYRDKQGLFFALAELDTRRMAETVSRYGLVQVMRDLLRASAEDEPVDWLVTQLEISRRLRTDEGFRRAWSQRASVLAQATSQRLHRQRAEGKLRGDVDIAVLTSYLELVLEGLISHLAAGLPAADLAPVLDVVEASVRR